MQPGGGLLDEEGDVDILFLLEAGHLMVVRVIICLDIEIFFYLLYIVMVVVMG